MAEKENDRVRIKDGRKIWLWYPDWDSSYLSIGDVLYYGNDTKNYMGFEVLSFDEDSVKVKVIEGKWGNRTKGDEITYDSGEVAYNLRKGYFTPYLDDLDEEYSHGGGIGKHQNPTLNDYCTITVNGNIPTTSNNYETPYQNDIIRLNIYESSVKENAYDVEIFSTSDFWDKYSPMQRRKSQKPYVDEIKSQINDLLQKETNGAVKLKSLKMYRAKASMAKGGNVGDKIFISDDDLRLFLETKYTFGYEDEQTKTFDGDIHYNYDELVKFYGFKMHFANNGKGGRFDGWNYVIGTHPWIDYNLEKGNLDKSNIKYAKGGSIGGYTINHDKGKNSGEITTPLIWFQSRFDKGNKIIARYRNLRDNEYQFWDNFGGALFSFEIEGTTQNIACEKAIDRLKSIFKNGVPQKRGAMFEVTGYKFDELNKKEPFTPSFMTGTHIRNIMGDGKYKTEKGELLKFDDNGDGWDFYYVVDAYGSKVEDVPRLKGSIFSSLFGQGIIEPFIDKKMATGGQVIGRTLKFKSYNGDVRTGTITEQLSDGDYAVTSGFGSVLVSPDMIISYEEEQPVKKKLFGMFEDGGNINKEIVVIYVNEYPYYLKKAGDTTHLYMANSREGVDIVIPGHIGQYNGTPYYNDIRSWLKGGESPNGKKYTESFKDGGSIDVKKTDGRFLNKISNRVSKVWDEIGADSGGQIRSDKEMLNNYASKSLVEVEKLGLKQNSLTEKDFSFYENRNDHLLNEFLIWNNFYTTKFAEKFKDSLVQYFKESPNGFADPSIIKVVTDDEMYIPRSKIQSIKVRIDGKEVIIKGSDVLNGANR